MSGRTTVVMSMVSIGDWSGAGSDTTTVVDWGRCCSRWEPTPLPTAGVKIRSSSSLGSNSGSLVRPDAGLDRDAFAMLRLSLIALYVQDLEDCCGGRVVILEGLRLGIDIHDHFVETGRFPDDLVRADRVQNRDLIRFAELRNHLHDHVRKAVAAIHD